MKMGNILLSEVIMPRNTNDTFSVSYVDHTSYVIYSAYYLSIYLDMSV